MQKFLIKFVGSAIMGTLLFLHNGSAQSSAAGDERTLWKLEHDYFQYVEANDLRAYSTLWESNFLGWPAMSAAPVHKDHITGWITSQTRKGLAFKRIELKQAAIQISGDIGVTSYWVTYQFQDESGNGTSSTLPITHTWLRNGHGWHIIGGMSMTEPQTGQK
ncbi:MAG TPA: nuclear transport factor 2 family protein [Candidatus Acidoferrum sp.]|nr:nuclear transport factor 2 family protein [Candidatus Acidoferrum sp.]